MSWSGGGFFGAALGRTQAAPPPLAPGLRQVARNAYARGELEAALAAQNALLGTAGASGGLEADDYLFAGLLHHAAGRFASGLDALRQGVLAYPDNAAMQENLAVLLLRAEQPAAAIAACERAQALGTESPNVLDMLCEAFGRIGRPDLAVEAGRSALLAKDARFAQAPRLAAIPDNPPPPFNPGRPEENVIAYALWGNEPRYHVPLLESARLRPHLFPSWTMRVYHDASVDPDYLRTLASLGVDLAPRSPSPNEPRWRALLWRFEVIADPAIRRFLVRDADSLLTVRERVAIDAWLSSDRYFHAMRDSLTHTDLLLAGMWGGVGGVLPQPADLLRHDRPWRMETAHIDQDLLTTTVWPVARLSILVHDSVFHPCLGSVPFPPFGALPPGRHVGENSFACFTRA